MKLKVLLKQVSFHKLVYRNTVNLSYKILGEEDVSDPQVSPLLILHDLLGTKKHWKSFGKIMMSTTRRPAVIVDLRNHGHSPHVASHRYQEMAADVIQLLDKLSVKRAVFVGHSMGGKTSMCISLMAVNVVHLLQPHRVAGLLVLDISPASSPLHLTEYMLTVLNAMKAVELDPQSSLLSKKLAKKALRDIVHEEFLMDVILTNIIVRNQTIAWSCNLEVLLKHFKHISSFPTEMNGKKYRGPTLFLGGQLSDYIPPDDLPRIKSYFPLAVVEYIPNTGHNLHEEDPKAFLEYVITFCRLLERN